MRKRPLHGYLYSRNATLPIVVVSDEIISTATEEDARQCYRRVEGRVYGIVITPDGEITRPFTS
jgi:hypothetical protein